MPKYTRIRVVITQLPIKMCDSCGNKPATATVKVSSFTHISEGPPTHFTILECQTCANETVSSATECLDRDEEPR